MGKYVEIIPHIQDLRKNIQNKCGKYTQDNFYIFHTAAFWVSL
jgi:hypothetical protein